MNSSGDENRIHLGCGYVYRPEYINIDKYETSVADLLTDASNLPFKSNCVNLIETSQLIEHFDYVHAKHVLCECFRILKHEGRLILETPDLEESIEEFSDKDVRTQQIMMNWIFGIDSPGMRHKSGFSFKLLKALLSEIGYIKIKREKMRTRLYEPNMRITCIKPKNCINKQIFSTFRGKLRRNIGSNDSIMLIPLEDILNEIEISIGDLNALSEDRLNLIIARMVIANPVIPLIFLEELIEEGIVDKSIGSQKIELIDYLSSIDIHHRLFTLWIRSRKTDGFEENFKLFIQRMSKSIYEILLKPTIEKKKIEYLQNLEPTAISILHFYTIVLEAKKSLNIGIKEFHRGRFDDAIIHFLRSIKINPENPIAHWNLARLKIIKEHEIDSIIDEYEIALKFIGISNTKKLINDEMTKFIERKMDSIDKTPINEELLTIKRFSSNLIHP